MLKDDRIILEKLVVNQIWFYLSLKISNVNQLVANQLTMTRIADEQILNKL